MKISASFLTHTLRKWNVSILAIVAVFGMALVSTAHSQTYRGTINGTVTDQTGAVVVGAQVQVIDENTHFVSPVVTNGDGLYSVPFLTPDTYDVKVEAKGFAPAEQLQVVLVASDIKQVNFKLQLAAANVSVNVTANAELVQTESAAIGQIITPNEIENSPYIQDNPLSLATPAFIPILPLAALFQIGGLWVD